MAKMCGGGSPALVKRDVSFGNKLLKNRVVIQESFNLFEVG